MHSDKKPIVIIGGGLSALMIAKMIRFIMKDESQIIFVEQESENGGQFRSFDYGHNRIFDYGMHVYYESCIPEIDRLFTGIFPDEQWNILEGNKKDVAGLFINNRLQIDTPYVDLRKYDSSFRQKCTSEIFLHIEKILDHKFVPDKRFQHTAYGKTLGQFGEYVTQHVFVPIFEKLYQKHPLHLDVLANHLTTINRVALFEPDMAIELLHSEVFRARICYPDQLNLPILRDNTQRGFYPKKFGMARVIEKLRINLEMANCQFRTSSRVTSLTNREGKVKSITIQKKDQHLENLEVDRLYWTAGIPHLANLLEIDMQDLPYDKNNKDIFYVNLILENPPQMGELYYFYCFDPGFRTFRITNYVNYCPTAASSKGFPICIEMWMQKNDRKELDQVIDRAQSELIQFGVLTHKEEVSFAKAEKVASGGFPLPSVNNVQFLETTRNRIREKDISNLEMFGVYSSKDTFFVKDILTDAYNKLLLP